MQALRQLLLPFLIISVLVLPVADAQEPKPEPAKPKALVIVPDDEASIRVVCEAARSSPSLTLESVANVAGYCLGLLARIRQAQEKK